MSNVSNNRTLEIVSLLIITSLAFLLRFFRYNAFPLYGDEWGSITNAMHLSNSATQFFYNAQLRLVLEMMGLSEFSGRLLAMIYGAASIPLMYLVGKKFQDGKVGLLAASLFAVSAYNIAQSQEVRYYSQFGFHVLLALYTFYLYLKAPSGKNLIIWLVTAGLMIATTPNGLFPFAGSCAVLIWLKVWSSARRWPVLGLLLLLSLAMIPLILQLRVPIFFTLQRLADANQALSDPTIMQGWSIITLIKAPFIFFNFVVGPNVNPITYWWFASIALFLFGALFLQGVYCSQNLLKYHLLCSYMLIPMVLQIAIAEPLATLQYATIEPKYVMYAFPILLLFVSIGFWAIPRPSLRFALGIALVAIHGATLYLYYFSSYSYYDGRLPDIRPARSLLENQNTTETLFVVEGRAVAPFDFYINSHLAAPAEITYPEEVEQQGAKLARYNHILLVTNNWKICNTGERYETLYTSLNDSFTVMDGYVRYPMFVYLLTKRGKMAESAHNFIPAPVDCHGFYYRDLSLPFEFEGHSILTGFGIDKQSSPWVVALPQTRSTQSMVVLLNLEDAANISRGEIVGKITLAYDSGQTDETPLVYGENVVDAFADYLGVQLTDPNTSIAHSWHKQPLISSSFRHAGSYADFEAHIYALTIPAAQTSGKLEQIKIAYFAKQGQIRLWGVRFD